MARFYGSLKGQARTEATRRGSAQSGISAHLRGWDVGCKVEVYVDPQGEDRIDVWSTGGSNDSSRRVLLATFTRSSLGVIPVGDSMRLEHVTTGPLKDVYQTSYARHLLCK